ncbi:PEP-CTERM sorting domain-containing protein [Roseateles sp.]|uniref:PEP-CTERM sorting domain-containing protein n=1 Tax=Roseateles sp. TaxID=1971397 RepID=UPI00326578AB
MSSFRLRLGQQIGALCLALASLSAQADFASDITVKLIAPGGLTGDATPISLSQTVASADLASGVLAGNLGGSGEVSDFMLDNERVFFSGNSILIRAAAGDVIGGDLVTGYLGAGGSPARYEISGLSVTGQTITGFMAYAFDGFATSGTSSATGLQSPASAGSLVQWVNASTISFDVSSIVFARRFAGDTDNYAEFRIDLLTTPVPEPATWLLLSGGLLAVLRRSRKS